jgi:hypothetical protein
MAKILSKPYSIPVWTWYLSTSEQPLFPPRYRSFLFSPKKGRNRTIETWTGFFCDWGIKKRALAATTNDDDWERAEN